MVAVEVAVGLIFVFSVFSLVCTGINEWLSNVQGKRGKDLMRGVRSLLDGKQDPGRKQPPGSPRKATPEEARQALEANQLTDWFFRHPLVASHRRPGKRGAKNPSYVSARNFSRVVIDLLAPEDGASMDSIRKAVQGMPGGSSLKPPLLTLVNTAGTNVDAFRRSLEEWFDDQMDRVSGWYKRWAKKVLLALGLGVAMVLNVDTVGVARELYRNPTLRAAVTEQAQQSANCRPDEPEKECRDRRLEELGGFSLPIGWGATTNPGAGWDKLDEWALKALGWAITAGAVSMGAPFWFDLLGRAGSLRNAGRRPSPPG